MIALQKVTDILELFLTNEGELSLAEMSELSNLNKSTVNRIASYLVSQGYLSQKEKRGKYSLGMKFLHFASVIKGRVKIRELALRHLTDLKQTVHESCGLVIWNGKEATLIDVIHYNSYLRVSPDEVTKIPLHPTSCGKIFLANMAPKDLEDYCNKEPLNKYTDQTIVDPAELKKELINVKKQGVAFDRDEHLIGISSVGAAIKDYNGTVIAAAVVLGPTARLPYSRLKKIAPAVKECAREISHYLELTGA